MTPRHRTVVRWRLCVGDGPDLTGRGQVGAAAFLSVGSTQWIELGARACRAVVEGTGGLRFSLGAVGPRRPPVPAQWVVPPEPWGSRKSREVTESAEPYRRATG